VPAEARRAIGHSFSAGDLLLLAFGGDLLGEHGGTLF